MIINDILANPELAITITDDQIKKLAYGIEYYSVQRGDPADAWDTMDVLRNRLREIESRPSRPAAQAVKMVRCACGHTVDKSLVMSASLGTSCPDCYDRMSA